MSSFDRIKISEMPQVSASSLTSTDLIPILVPTGSNRFGNRKLTISDLSFYIKSIDTSSFALSGDITGSSLLISGSHTSRFIGNVEVTGSLTVTSSATFRNIGMTILEGTTTVTTLSASSDISAFSLTGQSGSFGILQTNVLSASIIYLNGGQITSGGSSSISSSLQFKNTDDVTFRNITASIISASFFIGDGSGLTNLNSPTSSNSISSSYSDFAKTASLATSVAFANITGKPTLVSSSLQFGSTDDVRFRNITASIISSSIILGTNLIHKFTSSIGDNINTTFTISHSLGTDDCVISVRKQSTGEISYPDVTITSTSVVLNFDQIPTLNQFKVIVIG